MQCKRKEKSFWSDVSEKVLQKREAVDLSWRDSPTQDLVWAKGSHARTSTCKFRNGHMHLYISKKIRKAGIEGISGKEHEIRILVEGGPDYKGF